MQRKLIGVILSVALLTLPGRVWSQDNRAEALQKKVEELQAKLEEQGLLLRKLTAKAEEGAAGRAEFQRAPQLVRAQQEQTEKPKTPARPPQDEKSKGQDQPKQPDKPQPKPGPITIPPRVPRVMEFKVVAFRIPAAGEGSPEAAAERLTMQFGELTTAGWEYRGTLFQPQPGTTYGLFSRVRPVDAKPAESKPVESKSAPTPVKQS